MNVVYFNSIYDQTGIKVSSGHSLTLDNIFNTSFVHIHWPVSEEIVNTHTDTQTDRQTDRLRHQGYVIVHRLKSQSGTKKEEKKPANCCCSFCFIFSCSSSEKSQMRHPLFLFLLSKVQRIGFLSDYDWNVQHMRFHRAFKKDPQKITKLS